MKISLVLFFLLIIFFAIKVSAVKAYTSGMSASLVLGQSTFSSNTSISPPTARSILYPTGIVVIGGKLVVLDGNNSRVLIYNSIPVTNNVSADVVIGQADFVSNTRNTTASSFFYPVHLSTDGTKLFISDNSNHRVLVYNSLPTTNNASADVVIGQPDMTTSYCDTTAALFCAAYDAEYDPDTKKLVITDRDNQRVLIYNSVPTTNGASADVVVGNSNMTGSTAGVTTTFGFLEAAKIINGKLLVADTPQNRVLIWNSVPTTNGATADVVIGQSSMSSTSANQGGTAGPNTLYKPSYISWDGHRLYISDWYNDRILVYNGIPTSNNASADMVIGQASFTADNTSPITQSNLTFPEGATYVYGDQLFVADSYNNRILIYNNVVNNPSITINSIGDGLNGKARVNGHISIGSGSSYTLSSMQAYVNGGGSQSVTPTDGSFNSKDEDWYFDYDKGNYLNNFNSGDYTIQFEATNSNFDKTANLLFFTPFDALTPSKFYEWRTNKLGDYPTFNFSVLKNDKSRLILNSNLAKYQIYIRKYESGFWSLYIDDIPIDPSPSTNLDTPKYQSSIFTAYYYKERSQISVTAGKPQNGEDKSFDKGGKLLPAGTYDWKVVAVDKSGHT
ncbi:hypothetical protein HY045_03875, partial [Candidatus Woesebacteria bacterium]|nr:hypothetical protein [Candidatus Woesebacteria bacterium]